jgi:hypothetical protein
MEREELIKLIMKRIYTRRIYAEGLADDILRLFSVVGRSEQCDHDYSDGTGTGWNVCKKCGDMY